MNHPADQSRQTSARRTIGAELALLQRQAAENGLQQLAYLIDIAMAEAKAPSSTLPHPARMSDGAAGQSATSEG